MEPKRLQRAALQWGGLGLIAELWVALVFVRWARTAWELASPELASFAESMNRVSQLKTHAFKYPASGVYLIVFVVCVIGTLGWLVRRGVVDAMAPDRPADEDPEAPLRARR